MYLVVWIGCRWCGVGGVVVGGMVGVLDGGVSGGVVACFVLVVVWVVE